MSFEASTIPAIEGVLADVDVCQEGNEWQVDVKVKNTTAEPVVIKVKLAAEPRFKASQDLFPGINYNGNAEFFAFRLGKTFQICFLIVC